MKARFFAMTLGNRSCASFVLAIEAERRLVGISEQSALHAFVPTKICEPAFLQKPETVHLAKAANLALGKEAQIEWTYFVKVTRDELYAIKLVNMLSVDNPLFQPAVLLPAAMMQPAQAVTALSLIAG